MYAECATIADVVQKKMRIDATESRSQERKRNRHSLSFEKAAQVVSGVVVFCCCVSALEEILCLDDAAHCGTAGRVDGALFIHCACVSRNISASASVEEMGMDLSGCSWP